jgi:hypothetical protein
MGRSVGVSPGSVGDVIGRAKACELEWSEVEKLTDTQLEKRLYGAQREGTACFARPMPDRSCLGILRYRRASLPSQSFSAGLRK